MRAEAAQRKLRKCVRKHKKAASEAQWETDQAMQAKEAQWDQGTTSHASTIISWAIGPRNVPIPRRIAIKTRVIRNRQILKHVLDTCITPLLKKFLQERLS